MGSLLILWALVLLLTLLSHGRLVTWTEEHQQCSLHLELSDYSSSGPLSIINTAPGGGNEGHIASSRILSSLDVVCQDLPYVEVFRSYLLNSSASPLLEQIAQAALSMYSLLEESKKPVTLAALSTVPTIGQQEVTHNGIKLAPKVERKPNQRSSASSKIPVYIHPFALGIPLEAISIEVPPKKQGVSFHSLKATFARNEDTANYFHHLRESLAANVVCNPTSLESKATESEYCLRLYDILASGSIPLFANNVKNSSSTPLALAAEHSLHPTSLYRALQSQYAYLKSLDEPGRESQRNNQWLAQLDRRLYTATVSALLSYTRHVLSTRALANHLLHSIHLHMHAHMHAHMHSNDNAHGMRGNSAFPNHILLLHAPPSHSNETLAQEAEEAALYAAPLLLHGLSSLLGTSTDITSFPDLHTDPTVLSKRFAREVALPDASLPGHVTLESVSQDIARHAFDLIVVVVPPELTGRPHGKDVLSKHEDSRGNFLRLWQQLCRQYPRGQVALVVQSGRVARQRLQEDPLYGACAAYIFLREGMA